MRYHIEPLPAAFYHLLLLVLIVAMVWMTAILTSF